MMINFVLGAAEEKNDLPVEFKIHAISKELK